MINTKKNIIWIVFSALIGFCIYILLDDNMFPRKSENYRFYKDSSGQMSIEEFIKLIQNEETVDIRIFYVSFSSDATGSISEADLFSDISLKIDIQHVAPFCYKYFTDFPDNLTVLEKVASQYPDFRYCCVVRSKSNKYIRFSIARLDPEILFINGQSFKVPFEVNDIFLKLLTARDYEMAIKYLEEAGGEQQRKIINQGN